MSVDLHLHTTASDGRSTPAELVEAAAATGLSVIAVTDHDTVNACREVGTLARAHGITAITGIEITAVESGRDVHMLGYFVDIDAPSFGEFLTRQRQVRVARAERLAERLGELGMPVDLGPFITTAVALGHTVGRPQVADAMISAGYVSNRRDAFERWLGAGKPAFVPRDGASPEQVIDIVHAVGGLISLAHPGRTGLDDRRIGQLVAAGLDALEVYHSDHDAETMARYAALADQLGTLRSGGSDFHGDPGHGVTIGCVTLPMEHWDRFQAAAARRH